MLCAINEITTHIFPCALVFLKYFLFFFLENFKHTYNETESSIHFISLLQFLPTLSPLIFTFSLCPPFPHPFYDSDKNFSVFSGDNTPASMPEFWLAVSCAYRHHFCKFLILWLCWVQMTPFPTVFLSNHSSCLLLLHKVLKTLEHG